MKLKRKEKNYTGVISQFFTAGHVSSQQSEVTNSSWKGRGPMKNFLGKATFSESFDRICSTSRDHDIAALNELMGLRKYKKRRSSHYDTSLQKSKANSTRYSSITRISISSNTLCVKKKESSTESSIVNLEGDIKWKDNVYQIFICDCAFYKSTG